MPSGRPRASDTAWRASPTFVRSGKSFFAKIFVFHACSVQGGFAFSLGSSDARATGGTITTFGDYVIHNFPSSGIFQITDSSLTEVDVLVVGGGGGGGAGSAGTDGTGSSGSGIGGPGTSSAISGTSVTYAGGGGGTGGYSGAGSAGGTGGGGAGAGTPLNNTGSDSTGESGTTNLGGGGGAAANGSQNPTASAPGFSSGGNGGSGIVIISYPT